MSSTETTQIAEPSPKPSGSESEAPRLVDGVELVGQFKDSGFKNPPYLARRRDGQVVQLTELLFRVAEQIDGSKNLEQIAQKVSDTYGKAVSADNVRQLIDRQLRRSGLVKLKDGSDPKVTRLDPMLALKFRKAFLPKGGVRALAAVLKPLFHPLIVIPVLGGLAAVDWWLFGVHGVAGGLRAAVQDPAAFLLILGLLVVSAFFHELGHATACRYGGAEPGPIGAGLYIAWPAFYSDVTDSYRLGRGGRIRTDLGGVYFNVLFILATFGAYQLTAYEPLLLLIVVQHLEILHQFMPFLRLDGYYVIADLTGVPDLFARIKPILKDAVPGKQDKKASELKPWARAVVTLWVAVMIPLLLLQLFLLVVATPRIFATAFESIDKQYAMASTAFGAGNGLEGAGASARIAALAIPLLAITLTFTNIGKKLATSAWNATTGRPLIRTGVAVVGLITAGLVAYHLGPEGDYRPIQPNERGTVSDATRAVGTVISEPRRIIEPRSRSSETESPFEAPAPIDPSADPSSAPEDSIPSPQPSPSPEPSPEPSPLPSPTQTDGGIS